MLSDLWCHNLFILSFVFHGVQSIEITSPTARDNVDITKPYTIRWNHNSTDPAQISIDIVNRTAVPGLPTLDNLAHYIETTAGFVQIQWPASLSNETESYQLIFIDTSTGSTFGYSGTFNLTIPPGETRNATLGTTGAVGPHTAPSSGLGGGAIAGIVIGVLVGVEVLLAALFLFLRRRHRQRLHDLEFQEKKAELDAAVAGNKNRRTELAAGKREKVELEEKTTDFLKFELPSTPPRSPAEMDVPEIPAAEMPAGRTSFLSARNTKPEAGASESSEATDSTLVSKTSNQQHTIARKPLPRKIENNSEARPSVTVGGPPASIRADTASLRSGRTTRSKPGQSNFAAALYDLISQELRRSDL